MARLYIAGTVLLFCVYVHAKITLEKIELCEPDKDYAITFTKTLKNENGKQILEEGSLTTKVDLDDNILILHEVFALDEGKWNNLINLNETLCQVVIKHFGDFSAAIEKAAGLSKTCPYPKGEYKVSNVLLDFDMIDYSLVPEGKYKVNVTMTDMKTSDLLLCMKVELEVEH